jgi:hypothetical protein
MQSKVPLPTDNIYKFYALFGLLLLITSMYFFMTAYNDHRARQHVRLIELSKLESKETLNNEQKPFQTLLKAQEKIDDLNKDFYIKCISIFFIGVGFAMWQFVVQPRQDKLAQLTTEKLELELKILKKQSQKSVSRFRDIQ